MAGGQDVDGGRTGGENREPERGSRSRRDVLRASAGTVAASAAAATAGCLATLPPLGNRVRFGRVDAPETDEPTYTEWVPDPDAVDGETTFRAESGVTYLTPGDLGGDELGKTATFPVTFLKSRVDYFGHGFESYDEALRVGGVIVLVGDVDTDLAGSTATESGYEATGTYEGYDAFSREDGERAVLVGDDVVVWSSGSHARTDVRAAVDARDGRLPSLVDANEAFETVTTAAGQSPWTWVFHDGGRPEEGLGMTWSATNFEFDSTAAYYTQTYLFPDGETPSRGTVQDWLEKRDRPVDSDAVDVDVDGRTVTVEMRMPAGKYRRKIDSQPGEWPQITWGLGRDGEAVTVTHEAGDAVSTNWLGATYYPERTELDDPFGSAGDAFEPGDSVTFDFGDAPADTDNLSIWVSPPAEGSMSTMLSVPADPAEDA